MGSISWSNLNGSGATSLNITEFIGIAIHPTNANIAYGGSQDNGTEKFSDAYPWAFVQGGDGGEVIVDPNTPTKVYHIAPVASFGSSAFIQKSTNSGVSWSSITSGIVDPNNANFYPSFVMDPSNSNRLMVGTDYVNVTTDAGGGWAKLGTFKFPGGIDDIAIAPSTATPSTPRLVVAFGSLRTMAPIGPNTARERTRDTSISKSIRPTIKSYTRCATSLAMDTSSAARTAESHGRTSRGNLPDLPTWSFQIIPNGAGSADDILFIGNDTGVYRSTNLGGSWSRYATGLPNVQVRDLEYSNSLRILAAGTHGRGLWEIKLNTATRRQCRFVFHERGHAEECRRARRIGQ